MRKADVILIATAAAAVAVIAVTAAAMRAPLARRHAVGESDRVRALLRSRVAAVGLSEAYAELKKDAAGDGVAARHGKAHIFGELAYAADGVRGIAVCDADFTYGCYHGLIEHALAAEGLEALPRIDAACTATHGAGDTGCRHGIGHGLVEYFGPRDLADALDECAKYEPPGLLGCTQGAFMDYADDAADDPSLADPSRPDRPCEDAAPAYRPSCYFEQPYFWKLRLGYDGGTIAARCAALPDAAERRACLLGYGRSAAELGGYDASAVARACDRLAADGRRTCYAGAHWLFSALGRPEPAVPFCEASGDAAGCLEDAAAIK